MKQKTLLLALLFCTAAVAPCSDLKYTTEMKAGAGMPAMASTVYLKGQQERRDMNMMGMGDISTITQCPQKHVITVNHKCKLYFVAPMQEGAPPMAMPAGGPGMSRGRPPRQGGLVVVENEVRDTGERQKKFGMTARHIVVKMTMDAKEGSCNPGHHEMETDMWVVDLAGAQLSCRARLGETPPPTPQAGGCQDKYEVKAKGSAASPGTFPVKMTFGTGAGPGGPQSMTMEVTELSTATLDQSVFGIPAGYKQASSAQEVYTCAMGMGQLAEAMRGARSHREAAIQPSTPETPEVAASGLATPEVAASGRPRIGVVSSGKASAVDPSRLSDELVEDIKGNREFDAVRIEATTPAEIQKEAVEKKCEFVLYNNVVEARTKAPKIGGLLGRAAGIGGSVMPTQSLRAEYRLTLVQPFDQQVAQDNLSRSEQASTMEVVAGSLMRTTADRATADARRWNQTHR